MSTNNPGRIGWHKSNAAGTEWTTNYAQRGYTAVIALAANVYTLTITGSGAPAASEHPSLRAAKNQFAKYLRTKSA